MRSGVVEIRFEQTLDVPRDRLFGFFEDPANLALLMRRWPGFYLLGHDGCVRAGRVTRLEARWGSRLTWRRLQRRRLCANRRVLRGWLPFRRVSTTRGDERGEEP